MISGITLGAVGGIGLTVGVTPVILGFGLQGVVARSIAAAIQATIGNVNAGSFN